VGDLVAAAKAKPGSFTFGGQRRCGHASHRRRFMLSSGINPVHVPFKVALDVPREILVGRLDFYFSPLASAAAADRRQSVARARSEQRAAQSVGARYPNHARARLPNLEYVFRIGAFAPAATPRDVVARRHEAITKALADPGVANAINKFGAEPMTLTPDKFDEFIKREIESNAVLVKAAGIPRN
jgi:tripartite-type tricarboxylate transporter receptor subunit TctC